MSGGTEHQSGRESLRPGYCLDRVRLRELITSRVATHDYPMRAAVGLVCDSILIGKVASYIERDGWIDWAGLAGDLITGLPWSGGEIRLARLACSLSDQLAWLDDDLRARADIAVWSVAECLSGLDNTNRAAVLDAVHYAATGHPLCRPGRPSQPTGGEIR